MFWLILHLVVSWLAIAPGQEPDLQLKAAIERFFATQEAEDIDAYLALWSRTATRPQPEQLRGIFDAGDDRFSALEILRVTQKQGEARVRVSVTRDRTDRRVMKPDGTLRTFNSRLQVTLLFTREDGDWKLVREGSPADELAAALVAESSPAERDTLLRVEADLVTPQLLDSMLRRADPLAQRGQFKAAQGIYERVLEVARVMRDAKAEGRALQNIANSQYFQRDFAGAVATYEKRLALERAQVNDEGIAGALIGIATVRYSSHEYGAALTLYREALAIQEKLDEPALVATTLLSIANVMYIQGDYDGAIADYGRAETLKRKHFDLAGAAAALEGLGRSYAAQGDYSAALKAFAGLLDQARKRNDARRQGSALQNIGDTHFRLGNTDAARLAYDESRLLYEGLKDHSNAGRVLHGTAKTELLSGRFPQAEAAYGRSQELCAAAAPEADAHCVAAGLVGLAFAQASQERFDAAIQSYRKGIAMFGALQEPEAAARAQVGLAEALSGKQEYVAALVEAARARDAAVALRSDDLLWRALVSQARAQRRLKRADDALGVARAAVHTVRELASSALLRPGHAIPRDATIAFATTALLQAEAGDATAAWTAAEQMRAQALRIAVAASERDVSPGMTDDERAAERQMAGELTALFAQRDREKNLPRPDSARLKRLDTAIGAASAKRAAWQLQLFARLPELRPWRGLGAAATIAEVNAVVDRPGDLLLQFVVDDHDLVVLSAHRQDGQVIHAAQVIPVKRHVLAERVARAVEPAALADVAAWRKASADLFALLPEGIVTRMTASRRLVIIPDDVLWRVPFEAMPVRSGYLADGPLVTYAPSVTAIVRPPDVKREPALQRGVFVAAPAVPAAQVEVVKTSAPTWLLRPGEVAGAETRALAAVLDEAGALTLTDAGATEEAVRVAAAAASWLHLAGPFRLNAASPWFSSVLLARVESGAPDPPAAAANGVLEAREIPNAGLATRLAVFTDPAALSMREAAAAIPAWQWAWRAGGIETLILRRWGSDEPAASGILASFYRALRAGTPAAQAMQAARNEARRTDPASAPAVWAGWLVLSGG